MSEIITYLTKICFGVGAISEIRTELDDLNIQTPLIVTDPGIVGAGLLDVVIQKAGLDAHIPVFADTPENPTEDAVDAALAMYKETGADGVIAIGGGSSIDLAKGLCLMSTHEAPLEQYAAIRGGVAKIRDDIAPLIAVPTTAGTGSEVGRASLITLRNQRKLGFVSPNLIPNVAICDPELTLSMPSGLTAATGMDAISHCIETYLSPKNNPPAEAIALDGLGRAWNYLLSAVHDGNDIEARCEMMMAALQGALAFQKGLGAVHSMSHALGGMKELRLHHGTLNAVLLPVVLRFNADRCPEKYVKMRTVLGLPEGADLADAFVDFNAKLGLPATLHEMGVGQDALETAAEWSFQDHSTATNPRAASADDFLAMLRGAM